MAALYDQVLADLHTATLIPAPSLEGLVEVLAQATEEVAESKSGVERLPTDQGF